MHAGRKLRTWRIAHDLEQRDVAAAARMAQGVISLIERGLRRPTLEQAFKLQIATVGHVAVVEWLPPKALVRVRSALPSGTNPVSAMP